MSGTGSLASNSPSMPLRRRPTDEPSHHAIPAQSRIAASPRAISPSRTAQSGNRASSPASGKGTVPRGTGNEIGLSAFDMAT